MTISQEVIEFIDYLIQNCKEPVKVPQNVASYLDALRASTDLDIKPAFTSNGKLIIQYLQSIPVAMYRAREIAEGMQVPSKQVSGSMRKLCDDGYVEKIGQTPVVYMLTDKGKQVKFEGE